MQRDTEIAIQRDAGKRSLRAPRLLVRDGLRLARLERRAPRLLLRRHRLAIERLQQLRHVREALGALLAEHVDLVENALERGEQRLQRVDVQRILARAEQLDHAEQRRRQPFVLLREGAQAGAEVVALDAFDLERLPDRAARARAAAGRERHVQAAVGLLEQLPDRLRHALVDDEKSWGG